MEKHLELFKSIEGAGGKKKRKLRKLKKNNLVTPRKRQLNDEDDRLRCYKIPLPLYEYPDQPCKRKTFFDILDEKDRSNSRESG